MTSIQKLYEDSKSKGFVNHLIQSYLPVDKPLKIWEFKRGQKHQCNVCNNQKLFSIVEYFEGIGEKFQEISNDMGDFFKRAIVDKEPIREDHPIIKHVIGDKVIGWTAEKTDTCLCMKCIKDLLDLTQTAILMGDKNIIWLTKKMQHSKFFNKIYEDNDKENLPKKMEEKKITTFADLGVLQDIKKKMKLIENV